MRRFIEKHIEDKLASMLIAGELVSGSSVKLSAENGEIIVALIGEEATVKRYFHEADTIRLQPENDEYEPIYTRDCQILGKVIGLYRRY